MTRRILFLLAVLLLGAAESETDDTTTDTFLTDCHNSDGAGCEAAANAGSCAFSPRGYR